MTGTNGGIGLANVRRRLALCYGEETEVEVNVADDITSVSFVLPLEALTPSPDRGLAESSMSVHQAFQITGQSLVPARVKALRRFRHPC